MDAYRVMWGNMMEDGTDCDLYEHMDATSQTLEEAGALLFDHATMRTREWVTDALMYGHNDILVADRMELKEEYRRDKRGLAVLWQVVRVVGAGCGLVLAKPFPLQYSGGDLANTKPFQRDRRRLAKYWGGSRIRVGAKQ